MGKAGFIERHYRVAEVAALTGLAVATIRKRVQLREIGYSQDKRAVLIPESEVKKLLGTFHPAIALGEKSA